VRLDLKRLERCTLQLTLLGAGCDQIRSIDVSADGMAPLRVSSGSSAPAAPESASAGDASHCERVIELPFEAQGKALNVHLEPEAFTAPELVFTGNALELPIHRARHHARSRPPKPCVPPEYCRN
jgi:hypothetical protein